MITDFRRPWTYLSNFYVWPIEEDGIPYPTVEHFFQAHKTNDPSLRADIAAAATPRAAKYLGRSVVLVADWEAIKLAAMRDALELKFPYPVYASPMSAMLVATGDHYLQEGNSWNDRYWGVVNGVGSNWLGHLLMARRAELRAV